MKVKDVKCETIYPLLKRPIVNGKIIFPCYDLILKFYVLTAEINSLITLVYLYHLTVFFHNPCFH